jgi:hypothetical protein
VVVSDEALKEDRDREFLDWGREVTYRRVTAAYDPGPQRVSETHADALVTVIVGTGAGQPAREAAGQHLTELVRFLVKVEDVPTGGPGLTDRLVVDGREHEVVRFELASDGLVYAIDGRLRG